MREEGKRIKKRRRKRKKEVSTKLKRTKKMVITHEIDILWETTSKRARNERGNTTSKRTKTSTKKRQEVEQR